MAELMFEKGFLKGRSIKVPEGRFLIVGRAKEAGLPLPDPQLSRRHCKITNTPEGIVLEDLGSRNGSYVNGQPITTVKLKHGDEIVFGDQMARYLNPKDMGDSSGDFESEEAEATREIPELQPGQAMLLNPPKIERGVDSRPATHAPVPVPTQIPAGMSASGHWGGPAGQTGGLLPPANDLDAELEQQLPSIDERMPAPAGLDQSIEDDLDAPLPDLPRNTISLEETMVKPRRNAEVEKAPAPPSKIKKLMDSYKAEVMASKKDDVKAVPKARPVTALRPKNADGTDMVVPQGGKAGIEADATVGAEQGRTGGAGSTANKARPGAAADAQWENENKIEAFLEAADENLSAGAARAETTASGRDPVKAKTLALPAERTAQARSDQEQRELNDALFEEELDEEAEMVGEGADAADEDEAEATPARREPRPDETGPIDATTIKGINDEIVIDSSRIDRHREIADEIFRAAQAGDAESDAEEADVIEEVDEDFDLDSLAPVAAPTLDLGQLDRTENTAGSTIGLEPVDGEAEEAGPAQKAGTAGPAAAERAQTGPAATTMGRQITPMPTLPPILADEHVVSIGPAETYGYCDGLFQAKARKAEAGDHNLLEPIRAKNEEYSRPGQ